MSHFRPPLVSAQREQSQLPRISTAYGWDASLRPLTPKQHQHQSGPVWEERKAAVKYHSEGSHDSCFVFFPLSLQSWGPFPSSIWHKATRRPMAGAGLPEPASANSRTQSRHTGQWPLQATESCSVLYCLPVMQLLEHTNAPIFTSPVTVT